LDKAFDNRPAKFKVHAFDEDGKPVNGEPIEVKVVPVGGSGDSKDGVPVQVTDNGDGTYDVSYKAETPGDYLIHTNIRGKAIKDMPKKVHCYKGSDPTKTIVEGPGVEGGFAGKELPFTIKSIDKDGHPVPTGGDLYTVNVDGPTGPFEVKVKDNGDGTYSGAYTPTKPGDYKVHVSVSHDKRPVGKSPYTAHVKPGADPTQSFAVGAGWKEAWDALPAKFSIYAKDKDGKDVPGAEVKVFIKNVTPPDQKAKLQAEIAKMDPYIKKRKDEERKALLLEQKKQRDEAEAKAKAEGKDFKVEVAAVGDCPVEVRDNGDGTYLASYTPAEPGTFEITVLVSGENIKESPKIVPVNLTKPKVVFWQHTYDAEREEINVLKQRLAQAQEILKKNRLA